MKAEFKGNPLIEIPKNIPSYNFLTGDFGEEVLEEYNSKVKQYYQDNSNLKVFNLNNGIVTGSNSYSIFPMFEILSKYGLRNANPADVQKIINKDKDFLRGVYVDLGLVLRTENSPNEYLAMQLSKQAKDRKYEFSDSYPLVFKSSDLELIADNNSRSGLGFKIKESATPFNAPELSHKNYSKKFKITNENGVPVFDKNGNRTNYTQDNGLSRFYLGRYSGLDSRNDGLAGLGGGFGRVVVLNDAEGVAPKIFESDLKQAKDKYLNSLKELQKRIDSEIKQNQ
jgi:hypothetical protein